MTSSNNVNIDLRPGTRLVRETRGGREVMWVEDDTLFGVTSSSGSWFWAMILVLGFVVFGTPLFSNQNKSEQTSSDIPVVVHR